VPDDGDAGRAHVERSPGSFNPPAVVPQFEEGVDVAEVFIARCIDGRLGPAWVEDEGFSRDGQERSHVAVLLPGLRRVVRRVLGRQDEVEVKGRLPLLDRHGKDPGVLEVGTGEFGKRLVVSPGMSHDRTLVRDHESTGCQPLTSDTYAGDPVKQHRDMPVIGRCSTAPTTGGDGSGELGFDDGEDLVVEDQRGADPLRHLRDRN
jgi:hypothetical protein